MPKLVPTARTTLLIVMIATGITFASLSYVQPQCEKWCPHEPCKAGTCKEGEQKAGFPLPIIRDQGGKVGSSPTSGYGKIGFWDYFVPDIGALSLNILFYTVLLILAKSIFVLGKRLRSRL